jgi:catechol 2,3-dioxygenase-like lactoylglutathione lyase family enzyme
VWVGHVVLPVGDLALATTFWSDVGMREIERNPDVSILELRGGTHLILVRADDGAPTSGEAPFDLMVEDLDATHAAWSAVGLEPGAVTRGHIHDSFTVTDPDGRVVRVNSSHVVGPV